MMKKVILALIVIALAVFAHLSCSTSDTNKCADIGGDYDVTKTFDSATAIRGGDTVTVENSSTVLADTSDLSISQGTCSVAVEEIVPTPSMTIPYFGDTDKDDNFSFSIRTPSDLNIPLSVNIAGIAYACHFSGQITWDGTKDSSKLKGKITYQLTLRSSQPAECPDTLTLKYDFTAK